MIYSDNHILPPHKRNDSHRCDEIADAFPDKWMSLRDIHSLSQDMRIFFHHCVETVDDSSNHWKSLHDIHSSVEDMGISSHHGVCTFGGIRDCTYVLFGSRIPHDRKQVSCDHREWFPGDVSNCLAP
jgi:hypothetical protein